MTDEKKIDLELITRILNLYVGGMDMEEIAENVFSDVFYYKDQKVGASGSAIVVDILRKNLCSKPTIFNEEFFVNKNKYFYYILGYLFSHTRFDIKKDKEEVFIWVPFKIDKIILNNFKELLGFNNYVIPTDSGGEEFTLYFHYNCYNYFINYDIKEIPDQFILDFFLGVYESSGRMSDDEYYDDSFGKICNENKVLLLKDLYQDKFSNFSFDICKNDYVYDLCLRNKIDFLKVLAKLYSRKNLFVPSKYEEFLNHVRLTPYELMMETAITVAKRSTCLRRKVGCIITDLDNTNITSMGYNGSAKGEPNCCSGYASGKCGCIHAEINALLKGRDKVLFCSCLPCENCAKLIVNAGIRVVYYNEEYRNKNALSLFERAKIKCERISRENYKWKLEIADIIQQGLNESSSVNSGLLGSGT